jgi:3-mercaptopyruvate sulfurtransferase SseA
MRLAIITSLAFILAVGILAACNSKDSIIPQTVQNPQTQSQTQTTQTPAPDNARRITAEELHKLWEKNDVLIIDTRSESAYKDEHIKGSISVPSNDVGNKIDELPRNKMIVAYCT